MRAYLRSSFLPLSSASPRRMFSFHPHSWALPHRLSSVVPFRCLHSRLTVCVLPPWSHSCFCLLQQRRCCPFRCPWWSWLGPQPLAEWGRLWLAWLGPQPLVERWALLLLEGADAAGCLLGLDHACSETITLPAKKLVRKSTAATRKAQAPHTRVPFAAGWAHFGIFLGVAGLSRGFGPDFFVSVGFGAGPCFQGCFTDGESSSADESANVSSFGSPSSFFFCALY